MKKILAIVILLVLFTACSPAPTAENEGNLQSTSEADHALPPPTFPAEVKTCIAYYDSAIEINAAVTAFQRDVFYSYRVTGPFLPGLDGILSVFPALKNKGIDSDAHGRVLPQSRLLDGNMQEYLWSVALKKSV